MKESELFKHEFVPGPGGDFHSGDFHVVTVFSSRIVYETLNDGIDTWNGVFEESRSYSYSFTHQEFYDRFKDSEDHKPLIDFLRKHMDEIILFQYNGWSYTYTVYHHVVRVFWDGILPDAHLSQGETIEYYSHQEFYNQFANYPGCESVIKFLISSGYVMKSNVKESVYAVPLKSTFQQLFTKYRLSNSEIKKAWKEINIHYCDPHRYYHTLAHLRGLFAALNAHKTQLTDWEVVQFAVYYHDIVYEVGRNDNEEQSAAWVERIMQLLNIRPDRIDRCKKHILATKGHEKSDDNDTNLFTDADLSILGADPGTYGQYCSAIRKEYAVFQEPVYNEGRIRVLKKFLEMPHIYKTEPFQRKYEQTARTNLANELKSLTDKKQ